MPGFLASLWYGLWVPKDTPKDIIARLNADDGRRCWPIPPVQKRFAELGIQITPPRAAIAGSACARYQKAEAERWWPIIKASNIKVD